MESKGSSNGSSSSINKEEIDTSSQPRKDNAVVGDDYYNHNIINSIENVGPIVRRWMCEHAVQNSKRRLQCVINENCRFLCATSDALISHLKFAHNFNVENRTINYLSMSEFDVWKGKEEMRTHTTYIYKGVEKTKNGTVYNLRCQMSAPLCSENCKKKQKNPGFEFIEYVGICPSSIKVTETSDGSVTAIYHIDHLGHDLEDGSVRNMDPGRLPEQLCRYWSPNLQHNSRPKIGNPRTKKKNILSKLNFLLRRDNNNSEEFPTHLVRDTDKDCKMIHTWIKRLNLDSGSKTPIVFYRPLTKYKDFIMIIIHEVQMEAFMHISFDSILYVKIKKGEENVDLNMTAVSIITAEGEPVPIAFCLSRRVEYVTLYSIYITIYQYYGLIKPKFFVSDNLSQSYLAWKKVMPSIMNPMMCVFDLESIWEYKMTQRKVPLNKRQRAAAQLKYLLYEIDKETFLDQLNQILGEWSEDVSMKSFANFFKRNYANKCEEWAGYFRTDTYTLRTIDDDLEPVNGILDAIYMETYTGINGFLNYLMAYIRDSCLLKVIEWDQNYRLEKMRITKINHVEGTKIKRVRSNGSSWYVSEGKSGNKKYVVKTIVNNCNQDCGLFCGDCNVCVHQYSCPCKDYVVEFNLCKHIHAARMVMPRDEEKEEMTKEAEKIEQMVKMRMWESNAGKDKKDKCDIK